MIYLIEVWRHATADEIVMARRCGSKTIPHVIVRSFEHACEHDVQARTAATMATMAARAAGYRVYKLLAEQDFTKHGADNADG